MSLIYRGTSSDDVKFNVTERRVYNAPAFDVTGIEVPGRSGDILNSQERFKNKAIVYTGFIRSSDFPGDTTWERLSRGLRTIKAWVCGDAGKYHDLTDDYDPGFVRRAFVSGETAISEVLDRPDGATITITFMAEPFMYEESDPIELPETGTASGAIASFEGVSAPLQSLKFSIEPSQDLHGYDYPWPGGGGKNLLSVTAQSQTINGLTITVADDGVITVNGTATARTDIILNSGLVWEGGQTYIISGSTGGSNSTWAIWVATHGTIASEMSTDGEGRFTQGTTATNRVTLSIWSGATLSNKKFYPMVRLASVADATFAPYSNICPISGWTQVDAGAAGVNLLPDSSTMTSWAAGGNATISDGIVTATGSTTDYNTSLSTAKMGLELLDGTTYYTLSLWYKSASNFNLVTQIAGSPTGLDDSALTRSRYANWQSAPNLPNTNGEWVRFTYTSRTIIPDELINGSGDVLSWFMRFYFRSNATISIKNVQLEFGQVAMPYQDSAVRRIAIPLGQTVYGGYEDAVNGKMLITMAEATITSFSSKGGSTANMIYASQAISTTVAKPSADSVVVDLLSDKFVKSKFGSTGGLYGTDKLGIAVNTNGTVYVGFGKNGFSSLADANAWVAANPIQVVYPLATPIEVDLTPVSVSTLLGQNNVWASTGDTEVVYVEPTENPTEWPSKPRLEITMAGAGTLTVNGKTWSIGSYTGTLICDSEIMDWYDASNLKNSLVSGDGFPELQPGPNVITYTGGITKVVAKPRWRTL